jgi:uncharacterized membrane protein
MNLLPPIPSWDQIHPLVVHFPIALMIVVPLLMLSSLAFKSATRPLLVASFGLVALACAGAVLATASGEAGEHWAKGIPGADAVLHEHEELGERARNFCLGLTGVLAVWTLLVAKLGDRLPRKVVVIGTLVYLVCHAGATVVVANAAHEGGRLVHEFGVRAWSAGLGNPSGAGVAPKVEED